MATGGEGKIFKVTPDGNVSLLYTSDDSQVLCLALGENGSVYAGTGPGGTVVKIDAKGNGKVFCETGESYVWSLAVEEREGSLIAGTGPKGRVLRISPAGKASVFYSTKQEHVLCVAVGPEGVYAGTDKGGLVYRIDAKGKGFVLFQAPQPEVRKLELTRDGLYVGTSAPTSRKRGSSSASSSGTVPSPVASETVVKPTSASKELKAEKTDTEPAATSEPKSSSDTKESSKGSAASAPSSPASGENSVYRIAFDGTVREVFRDKTLVLSLLRKDGSLIVGTGMEGQLFEVDETTRERGEIARLDHGQILSLCRRKDGSIVLGTGDPGKLYVLKDRFASKGTITSEVLDAKLISKWGALHWQAETPAGTAISVAVRSGNVADPDETWSDWSAEQAEPEKAAAVPRNADRRLEGRRLADAAGPHAALRHDQPGAGGDQGRGAGPQRREPRQPEEAEVQVVRDRRQRGRAELCPAHPQGRLEQLGPARRGPRKDGLRMGHADRAVGRVSAQGGGQ